MIKIITGYTGTSHVQSDDMASFQQGIVGNDSYVLSNHSLNLTKVDDTYKLSKCDLSIQGVHCRLDGTEEFKIDNAGQGQFRKDYLIVRYSKNSSSQVESVELAILKGTPNSTESDSSYPTLDSGNIRNLALTTEVALYGFSVDENGVKSNEKIISDVQSLCDIPKIQSGKINIEYPKSGTVVTKEINFELPFNNFPNVVICPVSSNSKSLYFSVAGITKNSFSIVMQRETAVNTSFYWIAVGD